MKKKGLPNGFWTDFEGLKELYDEDFELAKKLDNNTQEIDFINLHFLPQMIKSFENEKTTFLPQKLAFKRMIDFLEARARTLKKSNFNFDKDLEEANKIIAPSDRLLYWNGRLNDYDRLYKYRDGIHIQAVIGGYSYEQLVKQEIELLEELLKVKEKKPTKSHHTQKQKQPISLDWQGITDKQLVYLFQRLKGTEMIDGETDFKDFRATFTGQPTTNIKPIKWIATNRLLAHFLNTKFNGQNWQNIAGSNNLFINRNDKPLVANDFSSANDERFGKPKGYEKIDNILSEMKNIDNS